MVIFDIGAAFIVGGAIAIRAEGQGRDLALVAGGLGCGAPGLVFLEVYPDWDWQYLFDPARLPPGVPALFLTLILLATLLGHWLAQNSRRAFTVAGIIYGLYCLASIPRIPFVGTRAQYMAGDAPLLPTPFLVLLATVGGAAFCVLALCWFLASRTRVEGSVR